MQIQVPRDGLGGSTGGEVERGAQGLDSTPRAPSFSSATHTHTFYLKYRKGFPSLFP